MKNIEHGFGDAETMNNIAVIASEKTKKDYSKQERKSGYKTPEYVEQKIKRKDESSEGEKSSIKISKGQGYIKDFESWVNSKIRDTKNNNK